MDRDHALSRVLEDQKRATSGECVTVGEIVDSLDQRAIGPALVVPAAIALSPIGAIPGISLIMGAVILMISLQLFRSRPAIWLPGRVKRFSFNRSRYLNVIERGEPYARAIERWLSPRLVFLTQRPFTYVIALICVALAVAMWPLAVVPFGAAAPSATILLFAIGVTTRDGLVVCAGFAGVLGVIALGVWLLL